MRMFGLVLGIMMLLAMLPGMSHAASVSLIKTDVGIFQACSEYQATGTITKAMAFNYLRTIKVNSAKDVYGNLGSVWVELLAYNETGNRWIEIARQDFSTAAGYRAPVNTTLKTDNIQDNLDGFVSYYQLNGNKLRFRICGSYKPEMQGNLTRVAIDHIPEINGTSFPEFAWWNSTWRTRAGVNVNTSTAANNYQVSYINITYRSGMQTDFDDLRFTDPTNTTELSYYLSRKVDSSWAEVSVRANITTSNGTQFVMYYNNSAATSNSSFDNVFTKAMNYTSSLNIQYHMDEGVGATIGDTSGNGNTGNANGLGWVAADGGYWGNFTGVKFASGTYTNQSGGYIIPTTVWHSDDTEAWTLEMWIATNDSGSANTTANLKIPLIGWSDANVYAAWGIDSSHLCYKHYSGAWIMDCGVTNVTNGTWHHVAYVNFVNGSGLLYVDGNVDKAIAAAGIDVGHYFEFREIGRGYPSATPKYFNGSWDEIRSYNRSLSTAEIRTNRERRMYLATGDPAVGITAAETYTAPLPSAINPVPANGATRQTLPPILNITPVSNTSATINVTFHNASDNSVICTNNSVSNNTPVLCSWATGTTGIYNYSWYVNVTDTNGSALVGNWSFMSIDITTPSISVNSPNSTYSNITMNIPLLNVSVGDPENPVLNVTFYNATNNAVICSNVSVTANTSISCNWTSITLNPGYTTFTWYANVTDGELTNTTGNYSFNLSMPGVSVATYQNTNGSWTSASNTTIKIFNATATNIYNTTNNITLNCSAIPGGNVTIQAIYGTQTKQSVFTNDCLNYTNASFIFVSNNTAYYFYIYNVYNVPLSGAKLDFYELVGGVYTLTTTSYSQVDGYVYEIYLSSGLPVQMITSLSGYITRNDTFTPYSSTILPIRIRLDELLTNGTEYDPFKNVSFSCTPDQLIVNNNTLITCSLTEDNSQLLSSTLRIYYMNYSGSYLAKNTACANPASCSFTFTTNKTGSKWQFNLTMNMTYGNYTASREYVTNSTGDINLPSESDWGMGIWQFIFFVIILVIVGITYGYFGALSLLLIPVIFGIGVMYHVFTVGQLILLLLVVFFLFMKMV